MIRSKTLFTLMLTLTAASSACKKDVAKGDTAKPGAIEITVTENGFVPEGVTVKKGEPVTLGFTRKTDKTCAKEVILQVGTEKIEKALPLDERVEIAVTFPDSGKLRYACGMDMISGTITVQ